jgi:hypothetical protein
MEQFFWYSVFDRKLKFQNSEKKTVTVGFCKTDSFSRKTISFFFLPKVMHAQLLLFVRINAQHG